VVVALVKLVVEQVVDGGQVTSHDNFQDLFDKI
jgi:hypothetical protein